MGHQSRTRLCRKLQRLRAHQAVANYWFDRGVNDDVTRQHLNALSEERLAQVQAHALEVSRHVNHPDRPAALMALGALAKLIQDRAQSEAHG